MIMAGVSLTICTIEPLGHTIRIKGVSSFRGS